MHKVTLSNQQLQLFINMTEEQISKKGRRVVISKRTSMGMQNIEVEGRGKKAIYTFEIPIGFYKLLMLPADNKLPRYSKVVVECIDAFIYGNTDNGFVSVRNEVVTEIARKCGKDYKTVKKTFLKIRKHFISCGFLTLGLDSSHRVKINGEWVTGSLAEYYENQVVEILKRCPDDPIFKDLKLDQCTLYLWERYGRTQVKDWQMAHLLGAEQYVEAKEIGIISMLLEDTLFAKIELLKTFDLIAVQNEIAKRQRHYKYVSFPDNKSLGFNEELLLLDF